MDHKKKLLEAVSILALPVGLTFFAVEASASSAFRAAILMDQGYSADASRSAARSNSSHSTVNMGKLLSKANDVRDMEAIAPEAAQRYTHLRQILPALKDKEVRALMALGGRKIADINAFEAANAALVDTPEKKLATRTLLALNANPANINDDILAAFNPKGKFAELEGLAAFTHAAGYNINDPADKTALENFTKAGYGRPTLAQLGSINGVADADDVKGAIAVTKAGGDPNNADEVEAAKAFLAGDVQNLNQEMINAWVAGADAAAKADVVTAVKDLVAGGLDVNLITGARIAAYNAAPDKAVYLDGEKAANANEAAAYQAFNAVGVQPTAAQLAAWIAQPDDRATLVTIAKFKDLIADQNAVADNLAAYTAISGAGVKVVTPDMIEAYKAAADKARALEAIQVLKQYGKAATLPRINAVVAEIARAAAAAGIDPDFTAIFEDINNNAL